ncbi:DUF2478 domain-containing protein [Maliponia aquimaris]|uniref:3-dehydroquinate dehydratase n=1 Tax=Maliponia aquimaris TaxID=1673631 RepID=A0A238L713_9RHOB|nr:DUF2478 domain-containing protein [Maliponia aquimaris]SMX50789.1 hypothetical protein MAA8898_04992 [Maliponia aquimaris]
MKIAYTMAPGRGDTDLLLRGVASAMIVDGYAPAGTAQVNTECPGSGPCDMDVIVLPEGPVIRISQSLGAEARGCRLDPEALETAVGLVQARLPQSDCLIVNKFGKHEAGGRGFRPLIADALALDLPVLVGLNPLNAEAFHEFTGGCAEQLAPEQSVLAGWLRRSIREKSPVA